MAKGKQNIDAKIKASFDGASPKPPRDLWSGLSQSLDNDGLDAKLKSSFEQPNLKAPDKVWSGVNQQLTIDRAWANIRRSLNRRTFFLWFRRAALLAVVFFGLYYYWPLGLQNTEPLKKTQARTGQELEKQVLPASTPGFSPQVARPEIQSQNLDLVKESTESSRLSVSKPKSSTPPLTGLVKKTKGDQGSDLPPLKVSKAATSQPILVGTEWANEAGEQIPQLKRSSWVPLYASSAEHNLRRDWFYPIAAPLNLKQVLRKNAWSIGLRLHYDRFNISNNMQRLARDANSLVAGQVNYGVNYEVYMQYQWSEHSSLELNYTWDELLEQSYFRFGEGLYLQEGFQYRFQLISLMYQHRFTFPGKWIPHFDLAAGPYLGLLKSVRFTSPLGLENRSDRYGDRYGTVLRLGQTIKSGDLNFSYGLQSQFSFTNFHKGKEGLPAAFDLSYSSRWGAYLGIAYQF